MTLSPHEWVIQKLSSYKEMFFILLGVVITLVIGWIVFLYIESGIPTRNAMLESNWEQVPAGYGCYSLSPTVLVIFIILLIAVVLYYGLPPGYHGRPK